MDVRRFYEAVHGRASPTSASAGVDDHAGYDVAPVARILRRAGAGRRTSEAGGGGEIGPDKSYGFYICFALYGLSRACHGPRQTNESSCVPYRNTLGISISALAPGPRASSSLGGRALRRKVRGGGPAPALRGPRATSADQSLLPRARLQKSACCAVERTNKCGAASTRGRSSAHGKKPFRRAERFSLTGWQTELARVRRLFWIFRAVFVDEPTAAASFAEGAQPSMPSILIARTRAAYLDDSSPPAGPQPREGRWK